MPASLSDAPVALVAVEDDELGRGGRRLESPQERLDRWIP